MLSTLDRYIGRSFYRGFVLVALVLITLFSFATLVQELDDVGKGSYELGDAILFVLLTIPGRFFQLAPVSALLGALFSLGALAAESELIAMRSIGASTIRIAVSSLKAAIPALILMVVVAQILGPKYEREARSLKATAVSEGPALETNEGFWLKDGSNFVRIGGLLNGNSPTDLLILEFDPDGRLARSIKADSATYTDRWLLSGVESTVFRDFGREHSKAEEMPWESGLSFAEVSAVPISPDTLAPTELIQEIESRKARGLSVESHELAFWNMVSRPISFLVMILFAVPFVFSSLRDSSQGRRTIIGAVIGVLFYLLDQISGYAGLIFAVPPILTSMAPSALIGFVALWLLSATR